MNYFLAPFALRKSMGLTQAQMGHKLDLPQNTINQWESGARTPRRGAAAYLRLVTWLHTYEPETLARYLNQRRNGK